MTECPLFPFPDRPGVSLDQDYCRVYGASPLIPVRLQNGRAASLVTRHADVRALLTDDRFRRGLWKSELPFARGSAALALVTSDPPAHSSRRKVLQGYFTYRGAERARPVVEAIAESLADAIEKKNQPVDLIESFAAPLPYLHICKLLGVPSGDIPVFFPWVTVLMSAGRFRYGEVRAAYNSIRDYFLQKLAACRAEPDDGLITALLQDGRLSDDEIVIFGFDLLMAGSETTMNHLGLSMQQVVRDPALAEALRRDPSRVPAAVEEMLRWTWISGVGGQPHVVTEDLELGEARLKRGDVAIPVPDAANRDPAAFDRPDVFLPDRAINPHLTFGHGRHLCLGAALARVELQVGLSVLLRRFSGLQLAIPESELDWRTQMIVRGTWSLPVLCSR